jgi:hypothetical protein
MRLGLVHFCFPVISTLLVSAGLVVMGMGVKNLIEDNHGNQRQKNLLSRQIRYKFTPDNMTIDQMKKLVDEENVALSPTYSLRGAETLVRSQPFLI